MKNKSDGIDSEMDDLDNFHCNVCNGTTEHRICFSRIISDHEALGIDVGFEISWSNTYMVISCCGCKMFSFVHRHWFSENTDAAGKPELNQDIYPHRISRKIPNWMHNALDRLALPQTVSLLMHEIYAALHQNLFVLASMGARSLLEHIMIDKVGDHRSFSQNMGEFIKQGYMGSQQKIQLEAVLEVGHAVTHRSYTPNRFELETVLDIAEALIATIYVHPRRASSLQQRIPRRKFSPPHTP